MNANKKWASYVPLRLRVIREATPDGGQLTSYELTTLVLVCLQALLQVQLQDAVRDEADMVSLAAQDRLELANCVTSCHDTDSLWSLMVVCVS